VESIRFVKYHGLGNDFIVVDTDMPGAWTSKQALKLCDRHFSIGADGLLLVGPGNQGSRASMRVLNADGSEPEMCGNGLRCVALHLALADDTSQTTFKVDTGAGALACAVERDGPAATVRIAMGRATLAEPLAFEAEGRAFLFERVSTGNPHAIVFDANDVDEVLVDRVAPRVSAAIPRGSNVEFVEQLGPEHLRVIVWERGVGRTLACGTGAVATAAAAAVRGIVPFERPVTVELPGGPLTIEVAKSLETHLSGPAIRVFFGEVTL
jgi:diaminopimelate epimerase